MRFGQRAAAVAAVAVVGAIALAGCGGDDDGDGDGGASGGDVTAFCDKVEELQAQDDPFAGVGANDIEGAQDAMNQYVERVSEVVDVAPADIRDDVVEIQTSFQDLADAIGEATTPQELTQAAQQFQEENADIAQTVQRLTDYTEKNCEK
jgi:hypothetical protein